MRTARRISVFRESLAAAAVLVIGLPPVLAGGVFFLAGLCEVAGKPLPAVTWLAIWFALTGFTLLLSILVASSNLRREQAQPHHSEYRDFVLMRRARHGPLRCARRDQIGGQEIVSFQLHYFLSTRAMPNWWPVFRPDKGDELVKYCHDVFLCVLPCEPPAFHLCSKSQRWESAAGTKLLKGRSLTVSGEFDSHYDLWGKPAAARLFVDEQLQQLLLAHWDWSLEIKGDRLLAYRIRLSNDRDKHGCQPQADRALVAEFARAIVETQASVAATGGVLPLSVCR